MMDDDQSKHELVADNCREGLATTALVLLWWARQPATIKFATLCMEETTIARRRSSLSLAVSIRKCLARAMVCQRR
jgi:hypothetical protein